MNTGLSHPACQSRDTLGGLGICHRLHTSPGDAAASPTGGNKYRRVGKKVWGSDKQKHVTEPALLEE